MSDINKKIILAIGLGVICYGLTKCKSSVKETFLANLPPMTIKADLVQKTPAGMSSIKGGMAGSLAYKAGDMYVVPGTFQSSLAPRFDNNQYGAYIRYNAPSIQDMAAPRDPLSYADLVPGSSTGMKSVEGYSSCNQGSVASNGNEVYGIGKMLPANYMNQAKADLIDLNTFSSATDLLPVQAMGSAPVGDTAPIVYDRFMFANQRSPIVAGADFIRGDLPIAPNKCGWFASRYSNPQTDLRSGALAVIGGINNDTTKELLALQSAATGNLITTGSGINYTVGKSMYQSGGNGDIRVSAYP